MRTRIPKSYHQMQQGAEGALASITDHIMIGTKEKHDIASSNCVEK